MNKKLNCHLMHLTNRVISRICECLLDQEGLDDPHLYRSVTQLTAVLNQCVLGNGTERTSRACVSAA